MSLFLILLVSLILLVALVRVLYINQLNKARDIADQGMPLPSLDETTDNQDMPLRHPVSIAQALPESVHEPISWQQKVKALRDEGRFQEALALCGKQYPRMLAFRQTLVTLRSRMKARDDKPAQTLKDIYRTAILARIAKASTETMTESDIRMKLPLLDNPRQYWNEFGYQSLDLLTKTDCKLLIRQWGEPVSHNDISQLISPGE